MLEKLREAFKEFFMKVLPRHDQLGAADDVEFGIFLNES